MKLYQLITLPNVTDLELFDDIVHATRTPNPVFATFQGAALAAFNDANGERGEYREDDAQTMKDYAPLTCVEWTRDVDDTHFFYADPAVGVIYMIYELELGA